MQPKHLLFLVLLFGLCVGCEPADLCEDLDCGPGNCVEGVCDCPCGFAGVNCELEDLCLDVICCNGFCDPQTETCNCDPSYYGESCDILCVNGEFANGMCNCSAGYEGDACNIESRDDFLGWWTCEQWTWTSEIGDSTFEGPSLGLMKFDCGNNISKVEIYPTENSNGLMLLNSGNRLVGQVKNDSITLALQSFSEVSVYGSASLGDDRIISLELYVQNHSTALTELAKGKFSIYRPWKDCN